MYIMTTKPKKPEEKIVATAAEKAAAKAKATAVAIEKAQADAQAEADAKKAAAEKAAAEADKKKTKLFDTEENEVDEKDYFFGGYAPSYFERSSGKPVDREDMIKVFRSVFKAKHGFLFYKDKMKEVYLVIVPIIHSMDVGESNDSISGDFQKHAISFLNEGSVNLDTLKRKLISISKSGAIKIAE